MNFKRIDLPMSKADVHSLRAGEACLLNGPLYTLRDAGHQLLLKELEDVPDDKRTARYACAMALVRPGHAPVVGRGACEGYILRAYRGEGGFGYDPLFLSADFDKTFAEASLEEKNAVSHRARAIEAVLKQL